ncbi:hypothetical protein GCM10009799_35980 [Nocardiopsis rhodophaea]|uniref:Secreted protein n=1 Tax=Nocardiopsis rhodophaea TaxID=280238 RepID=A0ABN2TDD2_9ACTN
MATTKLILTSTLATAAIAVAGLSTGTAHAGTLSSLVGDGESVAGTVVDPGAALNEGNHTIQDSKPRDTSLIEPRVADNFYAEELVDTEDMISPTIELGTSK